ncbi:MAG: hypothetical protein HY921_07680 [Elusimicrobia bacterium]|nr:hypothetical protein [Elusimicrobiota bacterium]
MTAPEAAFGAYLDAIRAAPQDRTLAKSLLRDLAFLDPLGRTQFEFSLKTAARDISPAVRFLNMDAEVYSCRGEGLFGKRLRVFEAALARLKTAPPCREALAALSGFSRTPMDLYFGADFTQGRILPGFWLIFGGVDSSGRASFWPYDFPSLIARSLDALGLAPPARIQEDMLNLGFDVAPESTRYKFYYLCARKARPSQALQALEAEVSRLLGKTRHFLFFSERWSAEGRLLGEKLFVEFLEELRCGRPEFSRALASAARAASCPADPEMIARRLALCPARLSLVSLELDGTLTIYLRP